MKRDLVAEMNEYYEKCAPWHDKFMNYTSQADTESLLAPIVADVAAAIAGKDVLEIACGTGNWTQVLAARARLVLATDISAPSIAIAKTKLYQNHQVDFLVTDAYSCEGVSRRYEAAFASDWWSHVPRELIGRFLQALHAKLLPGAVVLFLDMLRNENVKRRYVDFDDYANEIHLRRLPGGRTFSVVKNYYSEKELREILFPYGREIRYRAYPSLRRWLVSYRVA